MRSLVFFKAPLLVLLGLIAYWLFLQASFLGKWWAVGVIILGSFGLLKETVTLLSKRQFALDYIALLAIIVSVALGEYTVGLVIVLMLSGGTTLEKYGLAKAKESLTALTSRIPNEVVLWGEGKTSEKIEIEKVKVGAEILVRKGEVVPLDGKLQSKIAVFDESSLTGEPYIREKIHGDLVRSGTINTGEAVVIRVTKTDKDSTYRKIINLVKRAQAEKAPLIRLAARYSLFFTVLTAGIALFGFLLSYDVGRILAVLVVATPCPLILATPIALFGGMNVAAKNRVLVKNLGSFELLSRATTIVLDKTGTITLGRPIVSKVTLLDKSFTTAAVYSIAEAMERNSLHPLAKAIVEGARNVKAPSIQATDVIENIGSGVSATINGKTYSLARMSKYHHSNAIELHEGESLVARFEFEDRLKQDSAEIIAALQHLGLRLFIFTGDREENAKKIIRSLGEAGSAVTIKANCTPEEKKNGITELKKDAVVAMVGDGINDAPALATADIGLVFSNEEHTAASEAADVIFLGGDLASIIFILQVARRTIRVALAGIWFGIGVSVILMIIAALGYVRPVTGAILQEVIDIIVIFNALRASR